MAKKGKIKISKVKRNNHMTNKLKKAGQLKLRRHKQKPQKHTQTVQAQPEYSDSDSASGEEWADMIDEEEKQYIMQRLTKQPGLLQNVPEEENTSKKSKKRKRGREPKTKMDNDSGAESKSDSDLEGKYEKEMAERPAKKLKPLLPIKTKDGVVERMEECDESESEQEEKKTVEPKKSEEAQSEDSDSGVGAWEDDGMEDDESSKGVITTVQLLAARRDRLNHEKLRIGALCSSLLESPEKKLKNLYPILYLMEERLKDDTLNLHSVRKLATLSAFEVFKDILPEYQIRHQDYSNVKLKKETLALYKYEKELLEFYKRYLQRLEKATAVLRPKKGDTRKPDEASAALALVSLRCLCGLLAARPYFNYATNIAQSVVPFLDRGAPAGPLVADCCRALFADDTRGEITLTVVRLINQLVKRRGERLNPSALDCLLSLKIKDVDLDAEADLKHKNKQNEKHKKRIINLSKKEKKRMKKLKEVERELLETRAHEDAAARRRRLGEVTRAVFHIYFRLLKAAPRAALLAAVLAGVVKFAPVINVELYSSLVEALGRRLRAPEGPPEGSEGPPAGPPAARTRLLCARAVLAVLAAAGDALTVDPSSFHASLYTDLLTVHAGGTDEDAKIVLEAVSQVCARARRVSPAVLQAFAKRLATLATQLPHHGALACLALLHQLSVQSKAVSALFDAEAEAAGSGRFDPALRSPEHCNAHAAALHELCALRRHYHPATRDAAAALLRPDRTLPPVLHKLSPLDIYEQYDGSQMAFKPSVPPPKPVGRQ